MYTVKYKTTFENTIVSMNLNDYAIIMQLFNTWYEYFRTPLILERLAQKRV